jgi:hypothetical protein
MWTILLAGKLLLPVTTEQVNAITFFRDMGVVEVRSGKRHSSSAIGWLGGGLLCLSDKIYFEIGFSLFSWSK